MRFVIDKDIRQFLDGNIITLIDGIDVRQEELVDKKSEFFTQKFLKDSKGLPIMNEPVHNIMHRFIRLANSKGYTKYLVLGAFGHGKSLCKGSKVLMYDMSFKKVEDVKVGDLLMGPDSKPRTVKFLGNGIEPSYRLTLSNGDILECNESHKLSLRVSRDFWQFKKGETLNSVFLKDYMELPNWIKLRCLKLYKVPLEFDFLETPENPYEYGKKVGNFRQQQKNTRTSVINKNIEDKTNKLLYYDNFDKIYLHNDRNVRLQVLAGLLDLHGTKPSKKFKVYRIKIKENDQFRDDLLFLCRSLGFPVSWVKDKASKNAHSYIITISGKIDEIPCRINAINFKRRTERTANLEYSFKIESIGVKEYFGFGVDKDHLYLHHDLTCVENTEQLCTGWVMHRIAQNPNLLCKIVHVSETEAVKRCRAIRDYITKDDDLHRIAPHLLPTAIWGSQRFIVKRSAMSKDGTVEAYGVLSTAIGGRANLLVFDDPQDLKTAVHEPSTRQKIEDTFKNIWLTRIIPQDSEVLVMMNKWHESDLAAVIKRNPVWSWMSIAVDETLGHLNYEDSFGRKKILPVWSLFNTDDLRMKVMEIGQREFDRGYRLVPYTDSDRSFPSFSKCCHFGVSPKAVVSEESNWIFIGGIDFASLKRPGTVLSVVAVHKKTGMKVPLAINRLRGTQELPALMVKYFRQFGVELFFAENNGVQDALIDMLVTMLGQDKFKRYGIKIEGFLTGKNKADPIHGLPSIEKEFDNQEWMFCFDHKPNPAVDDANDPWVITYYEFSNHPFYETTDIVMSLWFAREGAKMYLRKSDGPNIY